MIYVKWFNGKRQENYITFVIKLNLFKLLPFLLNKILAFVIKITAFYHKKFNVKLIIIRKKY
jgi:hypothetical protein